MLRFFSVLHKLFFKTSYETCQPCTLLNEKCGEKVAPGCCDGTACRNSVCITCFSAFASCGDSQAICCDGLDCYNNACLPCTPKSLICGDSRAACCKGLTCKQYVSKHGDEEVSVCDAALSLVNINFSLKRLVGFAVVMVATGLF